MNVSPRLRTTVVLTSILGTTLLPGCRESTGPAPPGGFNTETVSYKPPPAPASSVFQVTESILSAAPDPKATIDISAPLAPLAPLALEGVIKVPDPDQAGGLVYVEFYRPLPGGKRLITQTGQQAVIWTDSPDGHIHYKVEMKSPAEPGKHRVEMRLIHPPTAAEPIPFAEGEATVRKP